MLRSLPRRQPVPPAWHGEEAAAQQEVGRRAQAQLAEEERQESDLQQPEAELDAVKMYVFM